MSKVYGPLTLPSGKVITFKSPTGKDRAEVMDLIDLPDDQFTKGSIQVEMAIRGKCLETVDGNTPEINFKKAFDTWDDGDVAFYGEVFQILFGITEEKRNAAKEAAAFLQKSLISTGGSN